MKTQRCDECRDEFRCSECSVEIKSVGGEFVTIRSLWHPIGTILVEDEVVL